MSIVKQPLLKHKPGLISKNTNLGELLAQDSNTDPLNGNYTLLEQSGIITAYQGLNNQISLTSFSTQPEPGFTNVNFEASAFLDDQTTGKKIQIIVADFNMDGIAEAALVYTKSDHQLYLQMVLYNEAQPPVILLEGPEILIGHVQENSIWADCGHTDDGKSALILAYGDPDDKVRFWISAFDQNLNPVSIITGEGPSLKKTQLFIISNAILTGTTNCELVILFQGEADLQGNDLFIDTYQWSDTGISSTSHTGIGKLSAENPYLTLTTGSFLSSTIKEGIVAAWKDITEATLLATYQMNDEGNTLQYVSSQTLPLSSNSAVGVRLAAGDLNYDGIEELVIGIPIDSGTIPGYLHLQTYNFGTDLTPILKSEAWVYGDDTFKYIAFDLQLTIGNLENDTGSGIIIGTLGTEHSIRPLQGYAKFSLGVIQVDPELRFPASYGSPANPGKLTGLYKADTVYDSSKQMHLNLSVSLGDFNGKSVRVGRPVYKLLEECNNIIAIINGLPVEDALINSGQVTFNNSQSQETSLGLKTSRNFSASDTLNTSLGAGGILNLSHSITNTYGEGFSRSFEQFDEISQNLNILTNRDDFMLLAVNDFDTWEYPVYNSADGSVVGKLLLIFPTDNVKRQLILAGLNLNSYYRPRHILGTVLSYDSMPPLDYSSDSGSYCNTNMELGDIQITVDANWSHSTTHTLAHEVTQSQTIGTSAGLNGTLDLLGGISIGLDYSFEDQYSQSQSSNYEIMYMESTNINMTLMALDGNDATCAYIIKPYVYWSTAGGYLKLDYSILIPNGSSYFYNNYSLPNPSFHLSWSGPQQSGINSSLAEYTRDFNFVPSTTPGEIDIQVTIHNDTLGTAGLTFLTLYDGDPRESGVQIGKSQQIGSIAPRDKALITVGGWVTTPDKVYKIYGVISSTEDLIFNNEEYLPGKIGFGFYPVTDIHTIDLLPNNAFQSEA